MSWDREDRRYSGIATEIIIGGSAWQEIAPEIEYNLTMVDVYQADGADSGIADDLICIDVIEPIEDWTLPSDTPIYLPENDLLVDEGLVWTWSEASSSYSNRYGPGRPQVWWPGFGSGWMDAEDEVYGMAALGVDTDAYLLGARSKEAPGSRSPRSRRAFADRTGEAA